MNRLKVVRWGKPCPNPHNARSSRSYSNRRIRALVDGRSSGKLQKYARQRATKRIAFASYSAAGRQQGEQGRGVDQVEDAPDFGYAGRLKVGRTLYILHAVHEEVAPSLLGLGVAGHSWQLGARGSALRIGLWFRLRIVSVLTY